MSYGYCSGAWGPFDEARVPLDDRGFMYGDAVFESLRVEENVWLAEAHWQRLKGSLKAIGLPIAALHEVRRLVDTRPRTEGTHVLRVVVSRGAGPGLRPFSQTAVYASLRPIAVSAAAFALQTIGPRPDGFLPWFAKHSNYLPAIYALKGAPRGSEALWIDGKRNVLESGTGNILALFGTRYVTPPADGRLLAGTTRNVLVRELSVREERLSLAKLKRADAVWVTSAINIARPVRAIDGQRVPQRKSLTAALIGEYRRVACESLSST